MAVEINDKYIRLVNHLTYDYGTEVEFEVYVKGVGPAFIKTFRHGYEIGIDDKWDHDFLVALHKCLYESKEKWSMKDEYRRVSNMLYDGTITKDTTIEDAARTIALNSGCTVKSAEKAILRVMQVMLSMSDAKEGADGD